LIFSRRADTLLIRIATSVGRGQSVEDARAGVASLAPSVYAALSEETAK
jgi:hypothetical protein